MSRFTGVTFQPGIAGGTPLKADNLNPAQRGIDSATTELGQIVRVGVMKWYLNPTAPTGWLECNGAAVDRTTYSALFAVIGTTYGSGNGSTTFNLPDARGRFTRGLDEGRGLDPSRGLGAAQDDDIAQHQHTFMEWEVAHDARAGGPNGYLAGQVTRVSENTTSTGTESVPKNMALLLCIKV